MSGLSTDRYERRRQRVKTVVLLVSTFLIALALFIALNPPTVVHSTAPTPSPSLPPPPPPPLCHHHTHPCHPPPPPCHKHKRGPPCGGGRK